MPAIPELLVAKITPTTTEFVVVWGFYNFSVVKGFAQPVVAISEQGWFPEYASIFPFTQAKQIEIVISRTPPKSIYGAVDTQPGMRDAAVKSADPETNIHVLTSLVRNSWVRERSIFANDGVFQKSKERFESRDFPSHRLRYYNLPTQKDFNKSIPGFIPLSEIRPHQIAAWCAPPPVQRPVGVVPILLQQPTGCENPAHWDALPDAEKARLLYEDSTRWMNISTSALSSRRRTETTVAVPSLDIDNKTTTEGWNGAVSPEQRAALADDNWK